MTPPFRRVDFDATVIGVDETNGRFGDVSVDICKACGTHWLTYAVEYEAFTASGRYFRGAVAAGQVATLTPESAPAVLANLPWYFRGGSYYRTQGERSSGTPHVDL